VKYTVNVMNRIKTIIKCNELNDFNENNIPKAKAIRNKYIISSNGFSGITNIIWINFLKLLI